MGKIQKCAALASLVFCTVLHAATPGGVEGARVLKKNESVTTTDKGVTIFSVHTPAAQEHLLWSMGDSLLMTSKRMADLSDCRYVNFMNEDNAAPVITAYTRNRSDKEELRLTEHKNDLPLKTDTATLNECLYFNRALSYGERQRVESYLAMKYGITLSQFYPTSYFASDGTIVWDAASLAEYSHRIAAIGRDDVSGLCQHTASSASAPTLFSMTDNGHLQNMDFILCGDNDAPLTFEEKRGETKYMKRSWMTYSSTGESARYAKIKFDATQLQQMYPLAEGEKYWIRVKSSDDTYYYNTQAVEHLIFDSVKIEKEASAITLLAAPDFFVEVEKKAPSCTGVTGGVGITFAGGKEPFVLLLNGKRYTTANRSYAIDGLTQGTYSLNATDANGASYSLDFLLANKEMSVIPTFEPVYKTKDEVIEISADMQKPSYTYSWQLPDGSFSWGADIQPQSAGVYTLTVCSADGCSTQRELDVREKASSLFLYDYAYPNPTKDGKVYFKVQLSETAAIKVCIYDANGRTLSQTTRSGESFYNFQCFVPQVGLHFVTLQCGDEQKTYKIVRE